MDKSGNSSLHAYDTSAPEQLKNELANEPAHGKCPSLQKSENKTCLRSRKKPKQRQTGMKRNTAKRAKLAAKKSNKDRVPLKGPQQKRCNSVNQPSIAITHVTMDQMLPQTDSLTTVHATPILLDKSTVPRGQMLPVCQDQFLPDSSHFVENNWISPASEFLNPASCAFTRPKSSHASAPQMRPDPSTSHMEVTSSHMDPVAFPSVNFGQAFSSPGQSTVTNFILSSVEQSQIGSPLIGPSDRASAEDFTNHLFFSPSTFQSATSSSNDLTPENGVCSVSEAPCALSLAQESDLCSSSPLTHSQCDMTSPFWLDLLLDSSSSNLCFPDANLVDLVLSSETRSD
ncbi:uncharacterized protein LOC125014130 [Mugil cephalus]|uniref:uncharacterized protein LOC125014130 n=1 Tax=Mugil cephalus TaxID=48193 RepID=UPI001FB6B281|nr:uncharacterized protein LOC125014130 [Mugil cephalus]